MKFFIQLFFVTIFFTCCTSKIKAQNYYVSNDSVRLAIKVKFRMDTLYQIGFKIENRKMIPILFPFWEDLDCDIIMNNIASNFIVFNLGGKSIDFNDKFLSEQKPITFYQLKSGDSLIRNINFSNPPFNKKKISRFEFENCYIKNFLILYCDSNFPVNFLLPFRKSWVLPSNLKTVELLIKPE